MYAYPALRIQVQPFHLPMLKKARQPYTVIRNMRLLAHNNDRVFPFRIEFEEFLTIIISSRFPDISRWGKDLHKRQSHHSQPNNHDAFPRWDGRHVDGLGDGGFGAGFRAGGGRHCMRYQARQ